MPIRKLLAPGIESMLDRYREEIGEEFGIYRPVSERDAIMKESEKSKTDDKDKKEKSRRK